MLIGRFSSFFQLRYEILTLKDNNVLKNLSLFNYLLLLFFYLRLNSKFIIRQRQIFKDCLRDFPMINYTQ